MSNCCKTKKDVILVLILFSTYSLFGAIIEHLGNFHYGWMSESDPKRYPPRLKIQGNEVLTGFPGWGLVGLVMWQGNRAIENIFFPTEALRKSFSKIIFDFTFWATIGTLGEYYLLKNTCGKNGWKDGHLRTYDYSTMKYNYKGVISLPTTLMFGAMAVAFIRINPVLINIFSNGLNNEVKCN